MSCPDCEKKRANVVADRMVARMERSALGGVAKGPDVIARREVCKVCPHADVRMPEAMSWANFSTCQICDCNIAQKTKTAVAVCPDMPPRWESVQGF